MGRFDNVKATIDANIKTNGKQEITGKVLNHVMNEMIDATDAHLLEADGRYPDMSVGFADDLVGRGENVPAEFSFRASGGKSIKDGAARIKRLKGNSVVWNQGFPDREWAVQDGSLTKEGDTYVVTPNGEYPGIFPGDMYNVRPFPTEKVLVELDFYSEGNEAYIGINLCGNNISDYNLQLNTWQHIVIIATCDREDPYGGAVIFGSSSASVLKFKNMRFHNLTKMFGAGNEPTTIEEYNARKPIVADEYAYNEGEVIPFTAEGIKSIGDNAWNGEWEQGDVSGSNGVEMDSTATWRNKGYIRIIPNEYYYIQSDSKSFLRARFYDADKNFIGIVSASNTDIYTNEAFKTASNAHYMRFAPNKSAIAEGTQMCVSLVHSGYKEGKYFPYEQDICKIDSRILEAFPNGMMPWDMVYNKDGKGYIVKGTIGIKMTDFSIIKISDGVFRTSELQEPPAVDSNGYSIDVIAASYSPSLSAYGNLTGFDSICIAESKIWLAGPSLTQYSTAEELSASLGDTMVWYKSAEPTIIEYDEPFNLDYRVADFGTEEIIAPQPSAPISADIIYQFNAVDMIREHELEITELQRIIATMQAQLTSLTSPTRL